MRISEVIDYMTLHYTSGLYKNIPILLEGEIGIGKSSGMRTLKTKLEAATGQEFGFIDCRFAQLDAVDFRGIPILVNGKTAFSGAGWLPFEDSKLPERGILLIDEITLGDRMVRAAGYELVLDRKIGEHKVKSGWLIVAATNRIEDKCDIDDLPAALRDRFLKILVSSTVKDYEAYMNCPEDSTVRYLRMNPSQLHGSPENKSFATPRSWERVSRIVKEFGPSHGSLKEILWGCVGDVASDFVRFLAAGKTYEEKANEILARKRIAPLSSEDLSPVVTLLCGIMCSPPNPRICETVLRYIRSLPLEKLEIAMQIVRDNDPLSALLKDCSQADNAGWLSETREIEKKLKNESAAEQTEMK